MKIWQYCWTFQQTYINTRVYNCCSLAKITDILDTLWPQQAAYEPSFTPNNKHTGMNRQQITRFIWGLHAHIYDWILSIIVLYKKIFVTFRLFCYVDIFLLNLNIVFILWYAGCKSCRRPTMNTPKYWIKLESQGNKMIQLQNGVMHLHPNALNKFSIYIRQSRKHDIIISFPYESFILSLYLSLSIYLYIYMYISNIVG